MQMKFRVWGVAGGVEFDQVFESVADWRKERGFIERHCQVEVLGMSSVARAA